MPLTSSPSSSSQHDATLRTTLSGNVLVARLDRPQARNAINRPLAKALTEGVAAWAEDPSIRAVVITGTGAAFSAGADVKELGAGALVLPSGDEETLIDHLYRFPKPVVAAVNGIAAGGGASIAIACDMRVAAPEGAFEFGFTRIGLVPEGGSTFNLPRLVGPSKAAWLLYSGRRVLAAEAVQIGLVDLVVDTQAELLPAAVGLAQELTQGDPEAVTITKQLLRASYDTSYPLQRVAERRAFNEAAVAFANRIRERAT